MINNFSQVHYYRGENMELLHQFFESLTLPYDIIWIPSAYDEPRVSTKHQTFFSYLSKTELTDEALKKSGFSEVSSDSRWNFCCGRIVSDELYLGSSIWQKHNHFFGSDLIGRKDEFHQRMVELRKRIGDEGISFYPHTLLLPDDFDQVTTLWNRYEMWIIKPRASSKGKNIEIRKSNEKSFPPFACILQRYIDRPFLITGRKFDIRFYTLVTSVSPLVIYIHRQGLGLFATNEYNANGDVSDLKMHITNWEINKDSDKFVRCVGLDENPNNSKWSLPFFFRYLKDCGFNSKKIQNDMECAVIKAVIAGMEKIRDNHQRHTSLIRNAYEFLGIDLVLDENLNPYVLEVNVSPGMNANDSELDHFMKIEVLLDVYNMARIVDCDPTISEPCPFFESVEKLRIIEKKRKNDVIQGIIEPWDCPTFADMMLIWDFVDEQKRRRYFHRVYPKRNNIQLFKPCFEKYSYEDIVLNKWIQMDHEKRYNVLFNNKNVLEKGLIFARETKKSSCMVN